MPIPKKEFYFVRHGEANHNLGLVSADDVDVPLNPTGIKQAFSIKSLIEKLPIQTICVSPLLRAQETNAIISENLSCPVITVEELRECCGDVWIKMNFIDEKPSVPLCETVHHFMEKAIAGINKALDYPGPVLIVAHGGIHYAMCHQIGVIEHNKKIGHCLPIHFYPTGNLWHAKKVSPPCML